MRTPAPDERSAKRRALDDQIASEPQLAPLNLPPDAPHARVEEHLGRCIQRPVALVGVVENGVVRLIDPDVRLPEQARVIVVASSRA
ncbi:MAG TPA: hypothetical protein VJ783_27510 [Pirellulales bacterium]|nr:hypothetical protein [Pirellulales bacterium]